MREIKFRAWDGEKMWTMEELLDYRSDTNESYLHCILRKDEIFKDWILREYTGLKSKSGVEIYEGDIVRGEKLSNIFAVDMEKFDVLSHLQAFSETDYEIIGNVMENPELLIK